MSKFKLLTFEDYMDGIISTRLYIRDADDILLSKLFILRRILLHFGFGTVISLANELMTGILNYVDSNHDVLKELKTDAEIIAVFLFDNKDFAPCECCRDIVYTEANTLCTDCNNDKDKVYKNLYKVITSHWDNQ